jgi:hypothetical protein
MYDYRVFSMLRDGARHNEYFENHDEQEAVKAYKRQQQQDYLFVYFLRMPHSGTKWEILHSVELEWEE